MELGCEVNSPFAMFLPTIDRQLQASQLWVLGYFLSFITPVPGKEKDHLSVSIVLPAALTKYPYKNTLRECTTPS